jgi:PHD/YefM family antitoxin component YafN of YafNO toxin-antitoxin module
MLDFELLRNVKYVIDGQGKKAAVQVDASTWEALLAYMEDLEDQALIKDKLAHLRQGPASSGAVSWQDADNEW